MPSLRQSFDAVVDLPPQARRDWMDRHCPDPTDRRHLEALLAAHARTEPVLLDTPVAALIEALKAEDIRPPQAWVGERIGAFRLISPLGQGGMATVFLAEREDVDFQQRVAVKLLRRGPYSELQQQLFRRERQTLAALTHPAIARLIDGGVTDEGVPYLVMDHVDGLPITRHAELRNLDRTARLRLLCDVCRAVDAAHRQLVVHCDLKPSNILVTTEGSPRLLDFGVARLIDATGDGEGATAIGLTPGYAAPEQYTGAAVTTATDVYALGVLMRELLSGERPDESARHDALPKGDLGAIQSKATAAEPARRYASAGDLAEDLEHHLRHEPVRARTPSPLHRMRLFARRHRGGVAVAAMLMVAVLASLSAALWQAHTARVAAAEAQEQAWRARNEAQRANAVRDLLVQLFENEVPQGPRASLPDTATLLQRGAERARTDLVASPALQVEMLVVIARIYDEMSRYDDARPLLARAVAIARALPPRDHAALGMALSQQGQLASSEKDYPAALALLNEALAVQRSVDPHGLAASLTYHRRAIVRSEMDEHRAAIADHLAAITIQQARLPPRDPRLVRSYGALGTAYTRAHQTDQAVRWQRHALALTRAAYGNEHPETSRRLSNYGIALMAVGKMAEAEAPLREAVGIARRIYREPNADLAPRVHNLGGVHLALGRLNEAEPLLREAMAIEHAIGRERSPGIGFSLAKLSRIQELRGDLTGARTLADEARAQLDRVLPATHEQRLDAELRVLRLQLVAGLDHDLREHAIDLQRRVDAQHEPYLSANALYVRALAHARQGEDAAAIAMIDQALRIGDRPRSFPHDLLAWYATLAQLHARNGRPEAAARTRREGLAFADRMDIPANHPARIALATASFVTMANAP
ncbi:serine/threonine protein kinase [Pseudoxanthomonas sp. PXM03]|uniref:tetratricopeptide repeat protein n=1 Tax=Pseudoxanthomonas sp. PXM03 TaxID=2769284 RepID=UPI001780EBA7|nr:tetratricopeptide repeat protein [Pseudoxanthomonas sp. PXM03]MBD9437168.1 serine/threonine protein kinase [Pseudoxanthomonas sp. PXM03]